MSNFRTFTLLLAITNQFISAVDTTKHGQSARYPATN